MVARSSNVNTSNAEGTGAAHKSAPANAVRLGVSCRGAGSPPPLGSPSSASVSSVSASTTLELLRSRLRESSAPYETRFGDTEYVDALLRALRERAADVAKVRARVAAVRAENARRAASLAAVDSYPVPCTAVTKSLPNGLATPNIDSLRIDEVTSETDVTGHGNYWQNVSYSSTCTSPASCCSTAAAVNAAAVAAISGTVPTSAFTTTKSPDKDVAFAIEETAPRTA